MESLLRDLSLSSTSSGLSEWLGPSQAHGKTWIFSFGLSRLLYHCEQTGAQYVDSQLLKWNQFIWHCYDQSIPQGKKKKKKKKGWIVSLYSHTMVTGLFALATELCVHESSLWEYAEQLGKRKKARIENVRGKKSASQVRKGLLLAQWRCPQEQPHRITMQTPS